MQRDWHRGLLSLVSLDGFTLVGLTALVVALISIVGYALLRFRGVARDARRDSAAVASGSTMLSSAMQEAVVRLRDQGRALQARAEASERLSDEIVGRMTSGLLLVDATGQVDLVNPSARRLLDLPPEVTGDFRLLLAGVPDLADVIGEALRHGDPVLRRTLRGSQTRGSLSRLGLTISPVKDGAGGLQSVICLFNDITGVLELEEQLKLKESLAQVGELTAGIAHEFRNGLATIHGYARLMDPARLPEAYAPYLEGIRAETEALREVVSNFLNFARPAPLALGPVDLRLVLDRAIEDVRGEVRELSGRIDVSGTFPQIEGDEILLRQAFSNLCRNAVQACRTTSAPAHIAVQGDLASGETCRIVVTDNGPGIAPETHARIFQPFFTTRPDGIGLGLALVQKIVVTHNGRITARNHDSGGAVFEVVLPLRQDESPSRFRASTS